MVKSYRSITVNVTLFFRWIVFTAAGDVEAGSFPRAEVTSWSPLEHPVLPVVAQLSRATHELTACCGVSHGDLSSSPLGCERLGRAAPSMGLGITPTSTFLRNAWHQAVKLGVVLAACLSDNVPLLSAPDLCSSMP